MQRPDERSSFSEELGQRNRGMDEKSSPIFATSASGGGGYFDFLQHRHDFGGISIQKVLMLNTLLGWKIILVRGCENVAGKLKQKW